MRSSSRTLIIVVVAAVLVLGGLAWWFLNYACEDDWCLVVERRKIAATKSYEQCKARGFKTYDTVPPRCKAGERVFLQMPSPNETSVTVILPIQNATVGSSFVLSGRARVFENLLQYRLKDEDGTVLVSDALRVQSSYPGEFGKFTASITFPPPKGGSGTLEVFSSSAKDGSEENLVKIAMRFAPQK